MGQHLFNNSPTSLYFKGKSYSPYDTYMSPYFELFEPVKTTFQAM